MLILIRIDRILSGYSFKESMQESCINDFKPHIALINGQL